MRRLFLSVPMLLILVGPAVAQGIGVETGVSGDLNVVYDFDGQLATRKLALELLEKEGMDYFWHGVCLGYSDCGKRSGSRSGRRPEGEKNTIMTLVGVDDTLGLVALDVVDVRCRTASLPAEKGPNLLGRPAASPSNPTRERPALTDCFAGYRLVRRTLVENYFQIDTDGWQLSQNYFFQRFNGIVWETARSVAHTDYRTGLKSVSDGFTSGYYTLATNGKGRVLFEDKSEQFTLPGSSEGGSESSVESRCAARAASVKADGELSVELGEQACYFALPSFLDGSARVQVAPLGIGGSSELFNLCAPLASISDKVVSSLAASVNEKCLENPGAYLDGETITSDVPIDFSGLPAFETPAEGEIQATEVVIEECQSSTDTRQYIETTTTGSQVCTETTTHDCEKGQDGVCRCNSTTEVDCTPLN